MEGMGLGYSGGNQLGLLIDGTWIRETARSKGLVVQGLPNGTGPGFLFACVCCFLGVSQEELSEEVFRRKTDCVNVVGAMLAHSLT